MSKLRRWRKLARDFRLEAYALYLAAKDPRTPWYAKVVVLCVVGYALSPLDLIPDLIPVLGYLDDLVIIPLGISLAVRLVPAEILDDCRRRAEQGMDTAIRAAIIATVVIVALWVVFIVLLVLLAKRLF